MFVLRVMEIVDTAMDFNTLSSIFTPTWNNVIIGHENKTFYK
jgi:hypothetical protein